MRDGAEEFTGGMELSVVSSEFSVKREAKKYTEFAGGERGKRGKCKSERV
jgi:hypothetical protein